VTEYMTMREIYDDEPGEYEGIWQEISRRDYDTMEFPVVEVDPRKVVKWLVERGDVTVQQAYTRFATAAQKKIVKWYRGRGLQDAKNGYLLVDLSGERQRLVDGHHRSIALAAEKVASVKALDIGDGRERVVAMNQRRVRGNPDEDLRKLERAAAQGDRDALLALHTARQRAGVAETGEQALEYLLASGAAVRVFSNEFGNTQQLLARIGCGYLGDGAASPDRMWWSRGHPDVERQLPGAWAYHYRDWVVVLDEDASPEIRARLARLPSPARALADMVASLPGRLPSAARALERARSLARPIRLRLAADRSAASRARAEMTPAEEAEFAAEWRRYMQEGT